MATQEERELLENFIPGNPFIGRILVGLKKREKINYRLIFYDLMLASALFNLFYTFLGHKHDIMVICSMLVIVMAWFVPQIITIGLHTILYPVVQPLSDDLPDIVYMGRHMSRKEVSVYTRRIRFDLRFGFFFREVRIWFVDPEIYYLCCIVPFLAKIFFYLFVFGASLCITGSILDFGVDFYLIGWGFLVGAIFLWLIRIQYKKKIPMRGMVWFYFRL